MTSDLESNRAWIDIVDQIDVCLRWTPDPSNPGTVKAKLGEEIEAVIWNRSDGRGRGNYCSRITWRSRPWREFRGEGAEELREAKKTAALGVKLMLAELVYDAEDCTAKVVSS